MKSLTKDALSSRLVAWQMQIVTVQKPLHFTIPEIVNWLKDKVGETGTEFVLLDTSLYINFKILNIYILKLKITARAFLPFEFCSEILIYCSNLS